jgi:uncharacterized protein (UPF0332 family)
MVLEEIGSRLPTREDSIKAHYETCTSRKKFINIDASEAILHLEKAKHDLSRAIKEFEDDCWDWTIIKAYYSIHHATNALLIKKAKMFSKDHICLIVALKHLGLIPNEFYDELRKLHSKFSYFTAFVTFGKVSPRVITIDEFTKSKDTDTLLKQIIKEHICVFNACKFVELISE